MSDSYAIYLHIPFCRRRCGYCDFNTFAGLEALIPDYVAALCREIKFLGEAGNERLQAHTIFFGGGTPSLLPAGEFERIFIALEASFDLAPNLETSLEANPAGLSLDYLRDLRGLGFNRISLGMQSAHNTELRFLERMHDYSDVIQAVKYARLAGFDNLSLDLIFGLPGGAMQRWKSTLELALGLHPQHLSLYALSIEAGTPFGEWSKRGLLPATDTDMAADMYEYAAETLSEFDYTQYEISNWALGELGQNGNPKLACRHNIQYWRNLPYLGLGAGAHGYAHGMRTENLHSPLAYAQSFSLPQRPTKEIPYGQPGFPQTPAIQNCQPIDLHTEMGETMMMGLRLTQEGVHSSRFEKRFGQTLMDVFGEQIEQLISQGLLEWAGAYQDILRLTPRGRLLGNRVFIEFLL